MRLATKNLASEYFRRGATDESSAAPITVERHPDSFLRTASLRLGHHLRDGLRRSERDPHGLLTGIEMITAVLCTIPASVLCGRSREP